MDFDVYQFSKQDEPTVLADYAAKESAEYGATAKSGTVNGLTYYYYDATEESEGETYPTRTYILDTGAGYTELVFLLDGETAETETTAILRSKRRSWI
jgi:hypothetical protein